MRLPLRRTAVGAVAVLAVGGFAAGCGSDHKDDAKNADATTAGTGSSSSTSPSPSAGTSPSVSASGSPSGSATGSAGTGTLTRGNFVAALTAAIRQHHSAHLTMSFQGTLDASGDVSYAGSTPTMRLTMSTGPASGSSAQRMEMRFVDGTMYLQVPGMTPAGKFVAISKDDATFGPMLKQLQNFGPDGTVTMLGKGVRQFSHVGTSTIDGKSYEHYRVTVDPRAVAKDLDLPAQGTTGMPKSITEDLYLDSDNLLRRATMDVEGRRVVVDATDWGKPVHVTAPPAADVVRMPAGATG
jgi:hypothetical protein